MSLLVKFDDIQTKIDNIQNEAKKAINLYNDYEQYLKNTFEEDSELKYRNKLNNSRQSFLNQKEVNLNLEIDQVNEIITMENNTNLEDSLNEIRCKSRILNFKTCALSESLAIRRIIHTENKFLGRIFSASELIKYQHILGLSDYLDCNNNLDQALISVCDQDEINLETIRLLVEGGADINAEGEYGERALICAAEHDNSNAVKLLLDYGANINIKNRSDATALIEASFRGNFETVKLLLNWGNDIDIDSKDNIGITALIEASSEEHVEVVQLLLENGADVNVRNNDGDTALMLTSNQEIRDLLLERGVN